MTQFQLPSQLFLPESDVKLGRLVVDPKDPGKDYHETKSTTISTRISAVDRWFKNNDKTIDSHETKLIQVTAEGERTCSLQSPDPYLRNSATSPETRAWLQQKITQGQGIYMIVGYKSLRNIQVTEKIDTQSSPGVEERKSPLAISPFAEAVPSAEFLNVGAAVPGEYDKAPERRFRLDGEYVCAIQYRKLRWRWFSTKSVDNKFRSEQTWWEMKSVHTPKENAILVELANMPDGGANACNLDTGEVLVSPF